MPTRKVKGGYQYGSSGKVYKTKALADRQGRAIEASKARASKGKKVNPPKGGTQELAAPFARKKAPKAKVATMAVKKKKK